MIGHDREAERLPSRRPARLGESRPFDPAAFSDGWPEAEPDGLHEALARTIGTAVIPRLLIAHRARRAAAPRPGTGRGARRAVAHLMGILAHGHRDGLRAYVDSLLAHGMAWESLCLDLFAPAARHFGELWETDACSFGEVTLALSMLQQTMRERPAPWDATAGRSATDRRILLAAVPGNQHTFGLTIVEDFFRRAGWSIDARHGAASRDIVEAVRRDRVPVVGLALGCAADLPGLPSLVARIRNASANRSIAILVGGPYFRDKPDEAARFGADATASDAREALAQGERLIKATSRH